MDERFPAIDKDYFGDVLTSCGTNNMRSDSKFARILFRKMFTDEDIVNGNLTGETTRGQGEPTKPDKYDETRMEFIYKHFKDRLTIMSQDLKVSIERMDRRCFRDHIRDAANPVKKAARDAKKAQQK